MQRIIQLHDEGKDFGENDEVLCTYMKDEVEYYRQKYDYLKDMQVIGKKDDIEYAPLSEEMIRKELENLQVLTYVVTDKCNLKCRYCAYGEMYCGYDAREDGDLTFDKAKQVLDYLFNIWIKAKALSAKRTVTIGFYGGEPLMNFELPLPEQ